VENLVIFAKIILFLSLSLLSIFTIFYLKKIVNSFTKIEENISEIRQKLTPVLDNLNDLINKSNEIINSIKEQVFLLHVSLQNLKTFTNNLVEFEQNIKNAIEKPILEFISFIKGIISGISVFFNKKKEE